MRRAAISRPIEAVVRGLAKSQRHGGLDSSTSAWACEPAFPRCSRDAPALGDRRRPSGGGQRAAVLVDERSAWLVAKRALDVGSGPPALLNGDGRDPGQRRSGLREGGEVTHHEHVPDAFVVTPLDRARRQHLDAGPPLVVVRTSRVSVPGPGSGLADTPRGSAGLVGGLVVQICQAGPGSAGTGPDLLSRPLRSRRHSGVLSAGDVLRQRDALRGCRHLEVLNCSRVGRGVLRGLRDGHGRADRLLVPDWAVTGDDGAGRDVLGDVRQVLTDREWTVVEPDIRVS